jgi:hypothetical protein
LGTIYAAYVIEDHKGVPTNALPTFRVYLNEITANGTWPEPEENGLFSEVVD